MPIFAHALFAILTISVSVWNWCELQAARQQIVAYEQGLREWMDSHSQWVAKCETLEIIQRIRDKQLSDVRKDRWQLYRVTCGMYDGFKGICNSHGVKTLVLAETGEVIEVNE
jgi:hypothetical protein